MKIKYVWHDQPKVEKVFDTEKSFNTIPSIFRKDLTQEEHDEWQLRNFAEKKECGLVLAYEVIVSESIE